MRWAKSVAPVQGLTPAKDGSRPFEPGPLKSAPASATASSYGTREHFLFSFPDQLLSCSHSE